MTERSVAHATFAIERLYPVSPARVFHALSDPQAKARWFRRPGEHGQTKFEMDFRVGGREMNSGGGRGETTHVFNAVYLDIVPDERIVYGYDMQLDDRRISVSLATIQLHAEGAGTRLIFTEQAAFLDGYDNAGSRERGTIALLDALGAALERQTA